MYLLVNTLKLEKFESTILHKLSKRRKWGASHTSFDNLQKSFQSHYKKQVKEAAKKLIKEGLILQKPTNYGLEVSLNPKRKGEILEKINNFVQK